MRVAMLIVGTVAGVALTGFLALTLGVMMGTSGRASGVGYTTLGLGVMTLAWLFGVAFTWGYPARARDSYLVAVIAGAVVGVPAPATSLLQIGPLTLAGIALALVAMSFWAEREVN
jgi:hypothetical protein